LPVAITSALSNVDQLMLGIIGVFGINSVPSPVGIDHQSDCNYVSLARLGYIDIVSASENLGCCIPHHHGYVAQPERGRLF
jgi:hypothetical protein